MVAVVLVITHILVQEAELTVEIVYLVLMVTLVVVAVDMLLVVLKHQVMHLDKGKVLLHVENMATAVLKEKEAVAGATTVVGCLLMVMVIIPMMVAAAALVTLVV